MDSMDMELGIVMDMLRAARQLVAKAAERSEYACSRIKLIRAVSDEGVLDIDGKVLAKLELWGMGFAATINCAEESIADADKQLSRAYKHDAERVVSGMLEDKLETDGAREDVRDALGQTRARMDEARKFVTVFSARIEGFELPKLKVA